VLQLLSTNKKIKGSDIVNIEEEISFRPINYLGSKLRMLDFIELTINSVDPTMGEVCDLFAGSGSVSHKLSRKRKVTSVDIQEYSRVICSSLLKNKLAQTSADDFINSIKVSERLITLSWCFEPLIKYEEICITDALKGKVESLCDLIEHGSIITRENSKSTSGSKQLSRATNESLSRLKLKNMYNGPEALVTRYFGGLYFSFKQSVQLDAALYQSSSLPKEDKDIFLAAILSTASTLVNTVGKQFAQPIRPRDSNGVIKPKLGLQANKDRSLDVFIELYKWSKKYLELPISKKVHTVLRMDYKEALNKLNKNIKVVYADPPYTRDHYSRYYHVLETMCLRDNPKLSTMVLNGQTKISRGVYREDRHQSPFCIKNQAVNAFEYLFSKVRAINASLVLSYSPYDETKGSHPRLLTMTQLLNIANKYYSNVEVLSPGNFTHSKLTHSEKHLDASENAEVLIVCKI